MCVLPTEFNYSSLREPDLGTLYLNVGSSAVAGNCSCRELMDYSNMFLLISFQIFIVF